MLLVTKPVKRLGESRVKFKIIRQPFVIDRLVTQEVAREPPTLACVYLSIYQTACSAFVLSCSEMELIKVSQTNLFPIGFKLKEEHKNLYTRGSDVLTTTFQKRNGSFLFFLKQKVYDCIFYYYHYHYHFRLPFVCNIFILRTVWANKSIVKCNKTFKGQELLNYLTAFFLLKMSERESFFSSLCCNLNWLMIVLREK